jgi:hypothetical protein
LAQVERIRAIDQCLDLAKTRRTDRARHTVSLPSASDITARMSGISPVSSALTSGSDVAGAQDP